MLAVEVGKDCGIRRRGATMCLVCEAEKRREVRMECSVRVCVCERMNECEDAKCECVRAARALCLVRGEGEPHRASGWLVNCGGWIAMLDKAARCHLCARCCLLIYCLLCALEVLLLVLTPFP